MTSVRPLFVLAAALGAWLARPLSPTAPARAEAPAELFVDARRGDDDGARGTERKPLKSLSAALARLPEPLERSVVVHVAGEHATTGGHGMPEDVLELALRMRPGVVVTLLGTGAEETVLGWEGGRSMVDAREGEWHLRGLRIGTFSTEQRRGVQVVGPARVVLEDVTFRTRSNSDAGIRAERGGTVALRGAILLNEHLHDEAPDESFCGIVATEHGSVRFDERKGARLELGNGSLSAGLYGCIGLGCETARITSWGRQSNCFAVNDGGRIDVRGTDTVLCAKVRENTPIGPEHDGHILAEDAHITLVGANDCAITLQKASTFTCNDIELSGEFRKTLWAMSGSMFVGRFLSDVRQIEAHTGAQVHVEGVRGEVVGPILVTSGGVVSLPGGRVEAALGDRTPR